MLVRWTLAGFRWRGRPSGIGVATSIWLLAFGQGLAARESSGVGGPTSATSVPAPGSAWWWQARQDDLERKVTVRRDVVLRAFHDWQQAVAVWSTAARRERSAAAYYSTLTAGVQRQEQHERELGMTAIVAQKEAATAMAALSRDAWRAGSERRAEPRLGPLLTAVVDLMMDLRRQREALSDQAVSRASTLRASIAEVATSGAARAAAEVAATMARARLRGSQIDWSEVERRRSAVARHVALLAAVLGRAEASALPPPVARAGKSGHKREIALERRLPRSLLRMAEESAWMPRTVPRRRLGPRPDSRPWLLGPPGLPLLAPVAGRLQLGSVPPAGGVAPALWVVPGIDQVVSSPAAGRVMFAAPFRGFGQLLIIDCGRGYHVLLWGLTQLDVDRGASVVAGQAIGEIVAARKRMTRLYAELRHQGVPVRPDSWQVAREDKVRS